MEVIELCCMLRITVRGLNFWQLKSRGYCTVKLFIWWWIWMAKLSLKWKHILRRNLVVISKRKPRNFDLLYNFNFTMIQNISHKNLIFFHQMVILSSIMSDIKISAKSTLTWYKLVSRKNCINHKECQITSQ